MATNHALGMAIFVLGGLAGAVFYLPFKRVKDWAWESYWMIYAVTGLIIVPWVLAFSTSPNVLSVISHTPFSELAYCFACGAAWGFGGLTWGLMIRYLGVGLGLCLGAVCVRQREPSSRPCSPRYGRAIFRRTSPRSMTRPQPKRLWPGFSSLSSGSPWWEWRACPRSRSCPKKRRRRPSRSIASRRAS